MNLNSKGDTTPPIETDVQNPIMKKLKYLGMMNQAKKMQAGV